MDTFNTVSNIIGTIYDRDVFNQGLFIKFILLITGSSIVLTRK